MGRVLPEGDLSLLGDASDEASQRSSVKLIHPRAFFASPRRYDLIVNVDSLTEFDSGLATDYARKICSVADRFLSINHELNPVSVRSLVKPMPAFVELSRVPCWVRRGYVEELFDVIQPGA